MKKILSLILAILGIGLLISCVGKIDLDKPISNDNNHTTTDNNSTVDNNTPDSYPDSNVQLYSHNVRVLYTPATYDGEDYSNQVETFDFSFRFVIRFSEEVSGPTDLYNYSSDWLFIDSFDGTITFESVEYNVTGIDCYRQALAVVFNYNGEDEGYVLDSSNHYYGVWDTVSLYE